MTFETDPALSTPKARGQRLKTLRHMCGLTIHQLAAKYGIGASTIKYWESARSEGLSEKGATKIIKAMQEEGIYCTYMWLMHGVGIHPQIYDVRYGASKKQASAMNSSLEEEIAISNEIALFLKEVPNAITLVVFDDAMEPIYSIGDTIGGGRLVGEDIAKAIGRDCIIETDKKEILCRRLSRGNSLDTYNLSSINPQTTCYPPNIYDVKVVSASPIIRVWKRMGKLETPAQNK
jgi:HTH-type transcriptional regulator, cell division transcriptional repressor